MWKRCGLKAHATDPDGTSQGAGVSTNIEGAAGIVTLNRPRALNALTAAMRAQIAAAFAAWARDPQVYAAVIVSATDRAFCAGGDVREMVELGKSRPEEARRSIAAEYALNWQLDCFTKPTVSLIDGMVMGQAWALRSTARTGWPANAIASRCRKRESACFPTMG